MRKPLITIASVFLMHSLAVSQDAVVMVPVGHTNRVNAASFSPDGRRVITGAGDNLVKLWDTETGMLLANLSGHKDGISTAMFSGEGNTLITADGNGLIKLWEAKNGKLKANMPGHDTIINMIEINAVGNRMVTASLDGTAKIWNLETRSILFSFQHDGEVLCAKFSPDGKKVVTTAMDETLRIFDAASGRLLYTFENETGGVFIAASFSPDGKKILASSGTSGAATLLNAESGNMITNEIPNIHGCPAIFSPDGKKIITIDHDRNINILQAETRALISSIKDQGADIKMLKMTADGKMIIAIPEEEWEVKLFDSSGRMIPLVGHSNKLTDASFSNDGKKILTASQDGTVKIWDARTGALLNTLSGYSITLNDANFSKDGSKIILACSDSTAKLWSQREGKLANEILGAAGNVTVAQYSEDGERILTGSTDGLLSIWDAEGRLITALAEINQYYQAPAKKNIRTGVFSPDGKKIASIAGWDLNIWGIAEERILTRFENINAIYDADFSPDGKKILACTQDARVLDYENGNLLLTLDSLRGPVFAAAFSPDGKEIVTASGGDQLARVWDAVTGKRKIVLEGHTDIVRDISYSRDGKLIVAAADNNLARIWNSKDGKLLHTLKGHNSFVKNAHFSFDGKWVVTVGGDNMCKVWSVKTGELLYTLTLMDWHESIMQVPSGYYTGSPTAARSLHYVTGDLKVVSFDQFDIKYNRPDKVLEAIGSRDTVLIRAYRNAWLKRIEKLSIDTALFREGFSVPKASIENSEAILPVQDNEKLKIKVSAEDATTNLVSYNVWVNEVPLYGLRGKAMKGKKLAPMEIEVPLSEGKNKIEFSVYNAAGTESYRHPIYVQYQPAVKKQAKLYFIGIGIDNVASGRKPLSWCVSDVMDIASQLQAKLGKNFILADTLFNEKVTLPGIRRLKDKIARCGADDKVVIAYAGHGLLSKKLNYFLAGYALNFDNPEQGGIAYEEIESLLDSIPSRKKLLLLDACSSGEVDQKVGGEGLSGSFTLMKDLFVDVSKRTGTVVMAAAQGYQAALEGNVLGHGVFSYSILKAMEETEHIRISELKGFVRYKVRELTNEKQEPVMRSEPVNTDWQLW